MMYPLDQPTPAEIQRAGTHTPGRKRAWKPSPVRAKAMRDAVLQRDGHVCQLCGAQSRLELDHIKPYIHGGYFILSNLQTLCQACNNRKGSVMEVQE